MEERMYKQYGLYFPAFFLKERVREKVYNKSILLPVGHTANVNSIHIFSLFICIYSVFICALL